jgi:hypothetical protein
VLLVPTVAELEAQKAHAVTDVAPNAIWYVSLSHATHVAAPLLGW